MQHAVEKTFLVAQPVQPVALTSPVACYQSAINQWRPIDESLQVMVRTGTPRREVSSAPFGTQRCQIANRVGCLLDL